MRYNSDYLSRDTTTCVKGIFAIIILFQHFRQYITPPDLEFSWFVWQSGSLYCKLLDIFGQLMVVMFLFYSGYGIGVAYKKKGDTYQKGFLKKRIGRVLLHFDIAVFLFMLLALYLERDYTIAKYLLSFTGWESIGNSNWFIFDIIVLYFIAYIGMKIRGERGWNEKKFIILQWVISIIFMIFMYKAKAGKIWWCDTILTFPLGMTWSIYKKRIETRLKNNKIYWGVFAIVSVIFIALRMALNYNGNIAIPLAIVFAVLFVMLTMKVKIGNKMLLFLGINAFSIYILQRLPMIITTDLIIIESPTLKAIIVFTAAIIIACLFTKLTDSLDRKIFVNKIVHTKAIV